MIKRIVLVLLLVLTIAIFGTQFKRNIQERIEVMQDGSAIITRKEFLPESELAKMYISHYEEIQKDNKVSRIT